MLAAAAWLLAQSCAPAGPWCGADVACRVSSQGRDAQGIERVELDEHVPDSLPPDRPAALWLVYPGFQPFLAEVGAFRHEVGTPTGTFTVCVLPGVAARQRRASGQRLEGGLALLGFDPSRPQPARFPLDPALETARADGLLTLAQARSLDELERLASRRAGDLARSWRELAQSPYLGYSRKQLLDAVVAFGDPRPVSSWDDIRPERFFEREQRTLLRRRGHAIPGRCSLLFLPGGARVELSVCPLAQLAAAWNRSAVEKGSLPRLRALPGREGDEVDGVRVELKDAPPPAATRLVFGLLSAIEGLATTPEETPP